MIKLSEKSITLKDVAELSGVSQRVVAEIMNGHGGKGKIRFSEATREKVLTTAQEYNYRPNRAARNLKAQRHNAIGIYTGHSIYNVHDRTLNQLLECCRQERIFPVIETVPSEGWVQPVSLQEHAIDGAIIFADMPEIEEQLELSFLPVVKVNTNQRQGNNCITFDESSGIQLALEQFQSSGKHYPGLIGIESKHYSYIERVKFLGKQTSSKPPILIIGKDIETASGRLTIMKEMEHWLKEHPDLNSVILTADLCAPLFYYAAKSVGKKIPEDIAVIGYNDSGQSRLIQPEVTTLSVDYRQLAATAFEMLNKMIAGEQPEGPVKVPLRIQKRQSA